MMKSPDVMESDSDLLVELSDEELSVPLENSTSPNRTIDYGSTVYEPFCP